MTKKFFLFVVLLFSTSQAFAKTEGLYLGVDAIGTRSIYQDQAKYVRQSDYSDVGQSSSHISYGVGLNAKYAMNMGGFFVAPGVILEQNSFGASANYNYSASGNSNSTSDRLQVSNRYGAKVDFGFDSGWFAPYLTVGYAGVDYKTRTQGYTTSNVAVSAVYRGRANSPFYGVGMKFSLTKHLNLVLEYNYQQFYAKTMIPAQATDYLNSVRFNTRLDVMKLGLSYKF